MREVELWEENRRARGSTGLSCTLRRLCLRTACWKPAPAPITSAGAELLLALSWALSWHLNAELALTMPKR